MLGQSSNNQAQVRARLPESLTGSTSRVKPKPSDINSAKMSMSAKHVCGSDKDATCFKGHGSVDIWEGRFDTSAGRRKLL